MGRVTELPCHQVARTGRKERQGDPGLGTVDQCRRSAISAYSHQCSQPAGGMKLAGRLGRFAKLTNDFHLHSVPVKLAGEPVRQPPALAGTCHRIDQEDYAIS